MPATCESQSAHPSSHAAHQNCRRLQESHEHKFLFSYRKRTDSVRAGGSIQDYKSEVQVFPPLGEANLLPNKERRDVVGDLVSR